MNRTPVTVVGAGFAGCEAAWALARYGIPVILREMKPQKFSPAHHSPGFAELICSNSFKAQRLESAAGLLKAEMERLGSLCVPCAKATAVAAGGALAVDRVRFSDLVTERIRSHPLITVIEGEVTQIPDGEVILATGPLTSEALSEAIGRLISTEYLSFFDAAAPIVEASSIDMEKVFFAARYGRGDADYINCPFDKEGYERFAAELAAAETVELKDFEREQFRSTRAVCPSRSWPAGAPTRCASARSNRWACGIPAPVTGPGRRCSCAGRMPAAPSTTSSASRPTSSSRSRSGSFR